MCVIACVFGRSLVFYDSGGLNFVFVYVFLARDPSLEVSGRDLKVCVCVLPLISLVCRPSAVVRLGLFDIFVQHMYVCDRAFSYDCEVRF